VQDDGVLNIINYLFSLQFISMLPDCMQDILMYAFGKPDFSFAMRDTLMYASGILDFNLRVLVICYCIIMHDMLLVKFGEIC
jgi:hypothetical protein